MKKLSPLMFILASLALAGGLFALFNALPPVLPCTYPAAQSVVLALGILLIIHLFTRVWLPGARYVLALEAVLLVLAAWLGSYPLSPLGFSNGRIPFLRGFTVTTQARGTLDIAPGDVLTLAAGAPAAILPVTLLRGDGLRCTWLSNRGGALDEPHSCSVVYAPPHADYDILKLSLQPGCGLPRSVEQIRISILP